jgi:hypothetical protein
MNSIGKKTWAIAEGYIPSWSTGPEPEFVSHEAFCVLNATDEDAKIKVTIFYDNREPFREASATPVSSNPMCPW